MPPTTSFSTNADQPPESLPAAERSFSLKDAVAISLLVGSLVIFFRKAIFTPAMFFYGDIFSYSYPHARFIHEICRHGHLPYWNPYTNYGEPVLANPNFLFFYPYTLLIVLLPIDIAYTQHYVVHLALIGIGTYLLARRWDQSPTAALFAAFALTFSGPVLSLGSFYNHVATAAWLPWALLLVDRALEASSLRPWILLTVVLALQFLAGEPFTLLATFGLGLAYALHRGGNIRQLLASANGRILGGFIAVGCAMVTLAAVNVFPSLDLLRTSRRGVEGLPYSEVTSWSFHPLSLLETVLPGIFGDPITNPTLWTAVLSGRGGPYFTSIFIGFVPLFFALTGWALSRNPRRHFVAGSGLAFLLLAVGRFNPLFALAYLLFPPLGLVRFPVKLLVPFVLLISLLGGWGVDALRRAEMPGAQSNARITWPLRCLLAGIVVVWIASWLTPRLITVPVQKVLEHTNEIFQSIPSGRLSSGLIKEATQYFQTVLRLYLPGLAGFALGGLVWLQALERRRTWARRALPAVAILGLGQVVQANSWVDPTVPKSFYTYRPPVLARLQGSPQPYRFCYIFRQSVSTPHPADAQAFLNFDSIPEARNFSPAAQVAFRERLLLARGSMLARVEGAFNLDLDGSFPFFLNEFWLFAIREISDPARVDCLLGRTNVKYQSVHARRPGNAAREVAEIFNGSSQPSYLYENPCVTPRAYVAGSVRYSGDSLETLRFLSAPDFDAGNEVILAAKPGASPPVQDSGPAGRAVIVDRQPDTVTLSTEFFRPGYLVLLDRFDPNWHATVDGKEVPILRANLLFRAVRAEGGKHAIRFCYRQRGLKAGALVSLATLVVLAALYVQDPRRAGSKPAQAGPLQPRSLL